VSGREQQSACTHAAACTRMAWTSLVPVALYQWHSGEARDYALALKRRTGMAAGAAASGRVAGESRLCETANDYARTPIVFGHATQWVHRVHRSAERNRDTGGIEVGAEEPQATAWECLTPNAL
jgi:hypothetical protein